MGVHRLPGHTCMDDWPDAQVFMGKLRGSGWQGSAYRILDPVASEGMALPF